MKEYWHPLAIVGGCARLWAAPDRFDLWAGRVRALLRDQGILVFEGIVCWEQLEMKGSPGGHHAIDTPANRKVYSDYLKSYHRNFTLCASRVAQDRD